ncbi:MAG: hypothetical protein NTX32_06095 [Candidatus Firestonebacteria bacterium]|nr:hypothetical protein [Candidatus Firestonebacteria bacterium]
MKIVITSGHLENRIEKDAINKENCTFLPKPYDAEKLLAIIPSV